MGDIFLNYLGDDLVLKRGTTLSKAQGLIESTNEGVMSLFSFIQPWNPDIVTSKRLCWILCEGAPLQAWGKQLFTHIVNLFDTFLALDNETTNME